MRRRWHRTFRMGSPLAAVIALAPGAALASDGAAAPAAKARFTFGGALALAAPAGELADHIDVGGGLAGFALYGRPDSVFALRLDAGWLLYGTETLRRPVRGTQERVLEDVATTDNWIAHAAAGPQVMARSGRVRPYVHAFGGVSYFATTSELLRPRFTEVRGVSPPGTPLLAVSVSHDPFRVTTHYDDVTAAYGAGAGMLVGLGDDGTALDLGVRYVANGRVGFLAEGDPVERGFTPRRSRGHLVEFRVGLSSLR